MTKPITYRNIRGEKIRISKLSIIDLENIIRACEFRIPDPNYRPKLYFQIVKEYTKRRFGKYTSYSKLYKEMDDIVYHYLDYGD
jgi:hypothetical protein